MNNFSHSQPFTSRVTMDQAVELYLNAPLIELIYRADAIRRRLHPRGIVTWQIDRNVNITNVCQSGCRFCNFHCKPHQKESLGYVTTMAQYRQKIDQMFALGGDQLLLQGGMHPDLGIEYYEQLFGALKSEYPNLKLHALGPPEVAYLANKAGISDSECLERLVLSGLTSLPGAGAEILDSEIRRRISPYKCSAERWLQVMGLAHQMNLLTSATMMYGHVEEPRHRIEHLFKLRDLQDQRPLGAIGFKAFIAWPFQGKGTVLESKGYSGGNNLLEYLRLIAISRIVLDNIENIQASWLTVGISAAQMALNSGANDMGSIMIEENVVSSAGSHNTIDSSGMRAAISEAGFTAVQRDQAYNLL
ncbi:MAG: CofH family radical SAM protein [Rikenellaceae bacterium]